MADQVFDPRFPLLVYERLCHVPPKKVGIHRLQVGEIIGHEGDHNVARSKQPAGVGDQPEIFRWTDS